MLRQLMISAGLCGLTIAQSLARAELDVHDDYYGGFAQGAYYGLLLAGEDYEVAWCMRGELDFEARGMGTGEDFQRTLESLLASCRAGQPDRQSEE